MRILWSGLILGLFLNFLGWIGNVFLLGPLWEGAFLSVPVTAWRESPWRDVISLLPDFVYGIAICWAYAGLAPRYGRSVATALRATATTLLALVTFVPGAWLAHALMRKHVDPGHAAAAVTAGRPAP